MMIIIDMMSHRDSVAAQRPERRVSEHCRGLDSTRHDASIVTSPANSLTILIEKASPALQPWDCGTHSAQRIQRFSDSAITSEKEKRVRDVSAATWLWMRLFEQGRVLSLHGQAFCQLGMRPRRRYSGQTETPVNHQRQTEFAMCTWRQTPGTCNPSAPTTIHITVD